MSFAAFSDFSKILLSFTMLLGRLELYPILVMLVPMAWKRSKVKNLNLAEEE